MFAGAAFFGRSPSERTRSLLTPRPRWGATDRRESCQFRAFHNHLVSLSHNGWPRMLALLRATKRAMSADFGASSLNDGRRWEGEWVRTRLDWLPNKAEAMCRAARAGKAGMYETQKPGYYFDS